MNLDEKTISGHQKRFCSYYKMSDRKEEYDFYKSIGICVRCHKNASEPHKVMCIECADKEREYSRKKRERNHDKIRNRDLDKYHRLKEQGICVYCKKRPAVPGKTKCAKCLAKIKSRRESQRSGLARCERVSYGICYICGKKDVLPDHGVCEHCYKTRLQAINKCLSKRKIGD